MIYLDNAATTMRKPPEVVRAVTGALQSFGGAGRGAHGAALAAGMAVYEVREALARLFDAPSPGQVAFCANATEALNVANIAGLLRPGDHAITTAASLLQLGAAAPLSGPHGRHVALGAAGGA